jgi:hypothetical protein
MRSLTWDQVWAYRLARHFLHAPAPRERLVDVVRSVCGIHAQMMNAAEISLGIRVAGITRQDVRATLSVERSLVKTYGIRGTIHLFPADELPLWMAALRVKQDAREERRLRELGLDPGQTKAVIDAIGESLDGRCLTRDELGDEVARRAGSWALDAVSPAFGGNVARWQAALGTAAVTGRLCFGPDRGTKVTYVRPDQWIGRWQEVDTTTALREVFRRYLTAYGPATLRDFAQWFAMKPRVAAELLRPLTGELEEVDAEGFSAWLPADQPEVAVPQNKDVVRLLPHFDCYVVGMHPRDRLVGGEWERWRRAYGGAGNHPVVMIDGVLRGIWLYRRAARRLEIRVELFQELTRRQQAALKAAAARVGEIVEAEPELTVGPVAARPHL